MSSGLGVERRCASGRGRDIWLRTWYTSNTQPDPSAALGMTMIGQNR